MLFLRALLLLFLFFCAQVLLKKKSHSFNWNVFIPPLLLFSLWKNRFLKSGYLYAVWNLKKLHFKGTCFHELVFPKLGVSDPFLDDICSQAGETQKY